MDLYEAMDALYQRYGYYLNGVVNAAFPGASGAERMAEIMGNLREHPLKELGGYGYRYDRLCNRSTNAAYLWSSERSSPDAAVLECD